MTNRNILLQKIQQFTSSKLHNELALGHTLKLLEQAIDVIQRQKDEIEVYIHSSGKAEILRFNGYFKTSEIIHLLEEVKTHPPELEEGLYHVPLYLENSSPNSDEQKPTPDWTHAAAQEKINLTTEPVWMAIHDELWHVKTLAATPEEAAQKGLEQWPDETEITVGQFIIQDISTLVPSNLFERLAENIGEQLEEFYVNHSAEYEMVQQLYQENSNKELANLMQETLERWWRNHAAGYGVHFHYEPTDTEFTFTRKEIQS